MGAMLCVLYIIAWCKFRPTRKVYACASVYRKICFLGCVCLWGTAPAMFGLVMDMWIGHKYVDAIVADEKDVGEVQAKGPSGSAIEEYASLTGIACAKACVTAVIIGCLVRATHSIG